MTEDQFTDLQDLASGLRGTLDAMDQLGSDNVARDQILAASLYMSRKLFDLVHGLADDFEPTAD